MSTIPTADEARKAAEARRAGVDAELLKRRAELYGDVQLDAEAVMATVDVDDIPRLEAALAALRGESATTSSPDPKLVKERDDLRKEVAKIKTDYGREVAAKDDKIEDLKSKIADLEKELNEAKAAKPAPPTPTKTKTDPAPAEPVKAKKAKKVPASPAPKSKKVKKTDTAPAAPAKKTWRDRAKQLADNAKS